MNLHFWLPTISTSFIALSALTVAIGWRQIIRGQREAHQKTMLAGALFALIFFLIYLSKTIFVGNTKFDGPDSMQIPYLIFLLMHIVLAMVAAVFGIVTLLHAFNKRFAKHKKLGKTTAIIWFITATSGVMVYLLLYIMYPGGESTGLLDAIFG